MEGKFSETDTGRTALFIENNKNAEGALVIADKFNDDDRVIIYNPDNDSVVSMFFKSDKNFPYQMTINYNEETYIAHLTQYRQDTSSYDIIFQNQAEFHTFNNFILNSQILDLYEDDQELSDSENLRLRNITIALGLWGSIAASLEKIDIPDVYLRSFSSFLGNVKKVFTAVKIVATVVAVVVAPIVTYINPAAGAIVYAVAAIVIGISELIINAVDALEPYFDKGTIAINNSLVIALKHDSTSLVNGEEFHIGIGSSLKLDFRIPGLNNENLSLNNWSFYDLDGTINKSFFDIDMEKNGNSDEFQMIFSRINAGYQNSGKIAFGLMFDSDVVINDEIQPVLYRLFNDTEEIIYNNIIVVRFCIEFYCSDHVY